MGIKASDPVKFNFSLKRGNAKIFRFPHYTDVDLTAEYDITAWTMRANLVALNGGNRDNPAAIFRMDDGFTFGEDHEFLWEITAAKSDIEPGEYLYDIEVTIDGKPETLYEGTVTILPTQTPRED